MIKSIEVENLRGVSLNTKIDLQNKSLIIYGENGKGKSSIVDGIEFALTGDIKHISSSSKEVTLNKHAPNIQSCFKDIKTIVEFEDNSIISNDDEVCVDTIASNVKNSRAGSVNILRRAQLLDSIHAQPKERYDLLKPFLPLDKINEYENALKEVVNKLEKEKSELEQEIKVHTKNIQNELSISNINNISQSLSKKSFELGIGELNKIDDIPEKVTNIDCEISKIGDIKFDSNYRIIIDILKKIKEKESPLDLAQKIFKDIDSRFTLKQKEKIVFYEEFLNTGLKWIEEENISHCPFCENSLVVDDVIKRITERLLENSEYINVKRQFDLDYSNLNSNFDWWNKIAQEILENNTEGINDAELSTLRDIILTNLNTFKNTIPKTIEDNIIEKVLPEWSSEIINNADKIITKYNSKLLNGDVIAKITELTEFKNKLNMVYKNKKDINILLEKLNTITIRYDVVNTFYNEVVNQPKQSVQDIYDDIKEDINDFYNYIHYEEEIGGIDLKVKESTGKGSALLEVSFYERKGADPRAYFSEAHLDTLGLAIFLALYKRECDENRNLRFIVLDDILTSVDAAHRSKIMRLIFTKFKEHQFIITTHDKTLYKEIIEIEKKYGGNNKFKNIEICDWDIEQGPILDEHKSEFEKLQKLYKEPKTDKDILASKTGTFLELILNKLRYSLKLSIPAKYEDKYTIADIWDNLNKVLSNNKGFNNTNVKIIDNINSLKFLRNTNGCHYNEWAEDISKDEIKEFAKNVIEFYNTVYCNDCNTYIGKISNDEYSCRCKTLNYIKCKK